MAHTFDAALKDLLSPSAEDFGSVFGLSSLRPAVSLNVDLSTISAATDVVFGFGSPLQEITDVNFQSGPDPAIGARCLLYSAALRLRFGVPIRSLVILLRPKADSPVVSGELTYASGGSEVKFRYEVIRMWQQPVEPFLTGAVQVLPLATLCDMPPDRPVTAALRDVVHAIDRRLLQECEHAKAVRLMTAAIVLSGLRVQRDSLGPIFEGVKVMHPESTAFDYYVEEGAISTAHRFLLRQGERQFGPPGEAMVAALKLITDLDRLDRLADAVLTAKSWQELLDTP